MGLVLFYILGGITIVAALGVVTTRNIVYGALFLLVSLMGVAGLFVVLFAEFLALVQLLIYGGAIIIVILFALMLTRETDFSIATEHRRWPVAAVVSLALFGLLASSAINDSSLYNSDRRSGIGIEELGTGLFENWAVPFEIASIVLLVALIGAIVIGRSGDEEDGGQA
ncbi:MAG: NADH-quinone oxidoreductase subunit J [Chloroflexi bacterium]|nr:NADH-quinone oxidoreductase subunit J [Chloroflexota bacterium]